MNDRIWRFGTSSWSERSWVGPFYDPGTKPKDFLSAYARRYGAVEADTTYYRVPAEELVHGWRERTPSGFRMTAKFPRGVVHAGDGPRPDAERALVMERVGEEVGSFLRAMRLLKERCGPLLLQLPYFNRTHFSGEDAFLRRLDEFLGALPSEFEYAVEVRNKQWFSEALCGVLRQHGAAFCLSDHKYLPHPSEVLESLDVATASFSYVRLIGDRSVIDGLTKVFDKEVIDQGERLGRLGRSLVGLSPEIREVWAFANNHYAGHGPASIDRLAKEITGAAPTRPMSDDGGVPF
ncbi:MAG: hypothetical protein CL933_06715 [Deltaproteobacteria bacterium]|nr:hypothetical protein [Deltaproteobacteria bacterium]